MEKDNIKSGWDTDLIQTLKPRSKPLLTIKSSGTGSRRLSLNDRDSLTMLESGKKEELPSWWKFNIKLKMNKMLATQGSYVSCAH